MLLHGFLPLQKECRQLTKQWEGDNNNRLAARWRHLNVGIIIRFTPRAYWKRKRNKHKITLKSPTDFQYHLKWRKMHDNYCGALGFALHLSYLLVLILSLKCQHSGGAISVAEFGTTNDTITLVHLIYLIFMQIHKSKYGWPATRVARWHITMPFWHNLA